MGLTGGGRHLLLRPFEPQDQAAVRALVLAGLAEHWGEVDEALNADLDDIAAAYAGGRTVVAVLDGALVATGTLVRHEGAPPEIVRMAVAAPHRRTGVGRRIVEELLRTARAWGATSVVLETTSHWADAVAFYRSCGFTVTHEQDGPFGRDTWFERRLEPGP